MHLIMDGAQQLGAVGTKPFTDVHEPFTLAERFEQLDAIDNVWSPAGSPYPMLYIMC